MTKTILVVDDEADTRNTIKAILEKNKYLVITAVNGDDCLKKLAKKKVDLILLDIMMPGKPVRDVVAKIKKTPVIYLTAVRMSDAERKNLLKEENIADFIQKPFGIETLIKTIKKHIGI